MFDINEIKNPDFLQSLTKKEMKELCANIRSFLIENISKTGGHLSSNLGVVELTVAALYVFNNEKDKIIFDVGHQAYVYKILTGRASSFSTLRKFEGLSGFPDYDESEKDFWESGHSSTSISALSGFLIAKENGKDINDCISIIGDSSISNGEAFEGLNFISTIKNQRAIIILNDNNMGISKSVGASAKLFNLMRSSKVYHFFKKTCSTIFPRCITKQFHKIKRGIKASIQHENIFEDLGLDYYGPYNGNNVGEVIKVLERAKASKETCVVHLYTKKGKGCQFTENDIEGKYHGVGPFDIKTGKFLRNWKENEYSYTEVISKAIGEMEKESKMICITPAMVVGSRLKHLMHRYPNSIYDVGIAEEHAASMCAAIAKNDLKAILIIYSTFAQRAYDQILNDIARRNLNVTICVDRAGIISGDGSTHQGIYDISMFNSMPNVVISQGKNLYESVEILKYITKLKRPTVIRYPKSGELMTNENFSISNMNWDILKKGNKAVVISYGKDILNILNIVKENGLDVEIVNARFIRPIDSNYLNSIKNKKVLIYEQVIENGGLCSLVSNYSAKNNLNLIIKQMAIPDGSYVPVGDVLSIKKMFKIDDETILKNLVELCA